MLEPLKGEIDPDTSAFTVLRMKVEIRLSKRVQMRWGALVGDAPDSTLSASYSHRPLESDHILCSPDRDSAYPAADGPGSNGPIQAKEELGLHLIDDPQS